MTFLDPADSVVKPVLLGHRSCVKIMIQLFNTYNNVHGYIINIQTVTDEMFYIYCLSTYDPNQEFPVQFVSAHAGIPPSLPVVGAASVAAPAVTIEANQF